MGIGLNKETLGPLAIGGLGAYELTNGANGVIGQTIDKISTVLESDIPNTAFNGVGAINGFDLLGGGIAGLIARKKFGANKTTSAIFSLLTTGTLSGNPLVSSIGMGAGIGKLSGMALNYMFHGNSSQAEKEKLENILAITGGALSGASMLGVLGAVGLGGVPLWAVGATVYGGYKLALPAIEEAWRLGKNGISNIGDVINGTVKGSANFVSNTAKKMANIATLGLFKNKLNPATARA